MMNTTTDLSKFSLIFPDEATQTAHYSDHDRPAIDMFTLEELGLNEVFSRIPRSLPTVWRSLAICLTVLKSERR